MFQGKEKALYIETFIFYKNNIATFILGGMEWGTTGAIIGEVVQWDIYSNEWIPTSSILPRYYHTASVLPCDEVKDYCITKKKSFPKTESVDIQNVDGFI